MAGQRIHAPHVDLKPTMNIHVYTSVTCNYIPKARVLAESVKRFHPEFVFHLVLVDEIPAWFRVEDEPFDAVIAFEDLGIPNSDQWLFKHSVVEACTGVKGFALEKLLSRRDCLAVIYFDPDIVVMSRIEALLRDLEKYSVLLTPHLTEPEKTLEAIYDNEFSVLQHGIYNLGFLAVRNSKDGRRFAQWWRDRLHDFCYDDIPRGLFTDQRWADLAPAYFNDVHVLRGPEYNVCTWNLTHRKVEGTFRTGFKVNGQPLAFYHFSGLDSGAQAAMLDKYGAKMPALQELRKWYLAECELKGQSTLGSLPWCHSDFDNGEPVTALHRQRYRDRGDLQSAFPHPYATTDISRSYYHWFEANDESRVRPVSRLVPLKLTAAAPDPVPGNTGLSPRYRIFLSVAGEDPESALRAAREIRVKSFCADELHLIGSETELAVLAADSELAGSFQQSRIAAGSGHDEAFTLAANEFGQEMDFLFVTPAVSLCELWDIRLAWTARRVSGAATVSPVNDIESRTRLGWSSANTQTVDEVDALCYENCCFSNPEISDFARNCVYVNSQALRETGFTGSAREFATRASSQRWSHVLADHVYTGAHATRVNEAGGPPPPEALLQLRGELLSGSAQPAVGPAKSAVRRQLHVMHSWGGGIESWVNEYCGSDREHINFVLKSIGTWGAFGMELRLYDSARDATPIQQWSLAPAVKHTGGSHSGYRAAISEIIHRYGIDAILVSSLVGHSLDVFRTGLPTLMVCHDYYPFCPAFNVTFGDKLCASCGPTELRDCTLENVHNRFFRNVPPTEWTKLRVEFEQTLSANRVQMVAPSPSVRENYSRFMPGLASRFHVIPHGTTPFDSPGIHLDFRPDRRLRIVIIGAMAPHKGLALLEKTAAGIVSFADLFLVGCGEGGTVFTGRGITIIPAYDRSELPGLLQSIGPDVGLLLSVVPETFSFALQELFELGIPTVATRVGSFADRIQDGINGFLVDAVPDAVLKQLRDLAEDRTPLKRISQHLILNPPRRPQEMLADYEAVIGLPTLSERAYFASNRVHANGSSSDPSVQLYWKVASSEFREETSTTVSSPERLRTTLSLRIPEQTEDISALRLDLSNRPGFILLFGLRLVTAAGEEVWSWQNGDPSLANAGTSVVWLGGTAGALVYAPGSDPQLALPISPAQLLRLTPGAAFHVDMAFPALEEVLPDVLDRLSAGPQNDALPEHRRLLQSYVLKKAGPRKRDEGSDYLMRQLAAAKSRVDDLEASLSWLITAPLRRFGAILLRWQSRQDRF